MDSPSMAPAVGTAPAKPRRIWRRIGMVLGGVALVLLAALIWWKTQSSTGAGLGVRYSVPRSISPEARAILEKMMPAAALLQATVTMPRTAAELEKFNADGLADIDRKHAPLLAQLGISSVEMKLGGVPVIDVRPPNYKDDGTLLIHVHGGGWVLGSARSSLGMIGQMAIDNGKRVISIDYTLATRAQWPKITDEVIAVYKALLDQGQAAGSIGMFGDSAGGNIVAGSVLKLRDQGMAMPGAVLLLSPGLDFDRRSDTWWSLGPADPVLTDDELLDIVMHMYAPKSDWTNPYVSPIYGDFRKGYPPLLIQVGTKDRLLSDAVRMYQAVKSAGGVAVLDVYEGMPHVFQGYMKDTPEQKEAFAEEHRFWDAHLVPAKK